MRQQPGARPHPAPIPVPAPAPAPAPDPDTDPDPRPGRRSSASPILLSILLLALLPACTSSPPDTVALSGETMGTTWTVKVVPSTPLPDAGRPLAQRVQGTLDGVNARMSNWLDDSEVSRLARAPAGEPIPVSRELFTVLAEAAHVSHLSGGAFDVTVAPLVGAWGFGPAGREPDPPGAELLAELRQRVGWQQIGLDSSTPAIRKARADLVIDLSAIAKGWAVDRVADLLLAAGHDRFMVEVGGEVRTAGTNAADEPWRIALERPVTETRELGRVLPLSGLALATSGDYRNFWEAEGHRYSHTIDPRTGAPVTHDVAAVSVVAPTCVRADALATALLVLGPEGIELARREEIPALFTRRSGDDFVEETTPAFDALFSGKVD